MLGQVVAAVEGLAAVGHVAHEFLLILMLLDVTLAVVLADELAAAVVARVRPHRLVGVHVRHIVGLPDEGSLAEGALERLAGTVGVGPLVQLQVPLGGEVLVADDARVRLAARVRLHVHLNRRLEIDVVALGAFDVFALPLLVRHEVFVVGAAYVAGQRGRVDELLVAVQAGLGSVVVYLLVPSELLLRVEHFATEAHIVAQFLLDLKVVAVAMLYHVRVPSEVQVAQAALHRHLSCVNIRVFDHLLFGDESFVARRASETFGRPIKSMKICTYVANSMLD